MRRTERQYWRDTGVNCLPSCGQVYTITTTMKSVLKGKSRRSEHATPTIKTADKKSRIRHLRSGLVSHRPTLQLDEEGVIGSRGHGLLPTLAHADSGLTQPVTLRRRGGKCKAVHPTFLPPPSQTFNPPSSSSSSFLSLYTTQTRLCIFIDFSFLCSNWSSGT